MHAIEPIPAPDPHKFHTMRPEQTGVGL